MSEWQPIETAPKDGTKIIGLLSGGDIEICDYFIMQNWKYEDAGNGLFRRVPNNHGFWNNNTPIAWMPLPNPPNPTDEITK